MHVIPKSLVSLYQKGAVLLANYPPIPAVKPASFEALAEVACLKSELGRVAFQLVKAPFYFLLFGAITKQLKARSATGADLLVTGTINGSVGIGFLAELKRSAWFSWLVSAPWIRAYGVLVDNVAYRCATWQHPLADLLDYIHSWLIWTRLQSVANTENLTLKIKGIEVADLVIGSYLRFKPAPRFDVSDGFVQRLIWQAMRDTRQAHKYFGGKLKPKWYLTSYTTYLEHGIPVRVALQHDISVWSFGNLNCFGKKLSQSDPYQTLDYSGFKAHFDGLTNQDLRLNEAQVLLDQRLSGGIDTATIYMRQSAYGQSNVPMPEGVKGSVIIFLHDFYDSPHIYPDFIFNDFWQWICLTIEALQKTQHNFFLKPHPNQITMSDSVLVELRSKYPNLKWLSPAVSNLELVQAGMLCGVTVYGTVSHELAYLGIPSIACARHPHHSFDFCRTAKSREIYVNLLKTADELPVSKIELKRQALAFYYMHNLFGDEDQKRLRQALIDFWKTCNLSHDETQILPSFYRLAEMPSFGRFVNTMCEAVSRQDQD